MFSCFLLGLLLSVLALTSQAQPPTSHRTIFSVGDLHGDFDRFKLILQGLGLASFDMQGGATWLGGRSVLVSTGDITDRGDHSRPILIAFMSLARQAVASGGEVVNVLGNHDVMNLQGNLRYVSNSELHPNGDFGGSLARQHEFSAAGVIGQDIRSRFVAAAVRDGTLFVHAGLDPRWLHESGGLEGMNSRIRAMLNSPAIPDGVQEQILGNYGPLWDRKFAKHDPLACQVVEETLGLVGAKRMAVGHTPFFGGVETRCPSPNGPRIILGDTAISRAYPGGKASAVEYRGNSVTAVYFQEPGTQPTRVPLAAAGAAAAAEPAAASYEVSAPLTLSEQLLSLAGEVLVKITGLLKPSAPKPKLQEGWVQRPKPLRSHSSVVAPL